jgi:type IV secretion system protein TrbI
MSTPSSSKVSPESLALRAQPRPVTRLNRCTFIIVGAVLSLCLFGAMTWSLRSPTKPHANEPESRPAEHAAKAEGIDRLPRDYSEVPVLGPPLPGDIGTAALAQQTTHNAESVTGTAPDEQAREAERLERQRESEQAAGSPVLFRSGTGASSEPPKSQAPGAAVDMPNPFTIGTPPAVDPTIGQNRQEQKQAFLEKDFGSVTRGSGTLMPPPSPYSIMAGTLISAALVTGINSDLPGQIIATVTEPIYDSATGSHLLVPQGSRLLGRYDSQIAYGQQRVLVIWTRLIMPDTSSITLDRLPGIDAQGYAGVQDGVDWHWDRIFAGAAVSTLIGVGAELAAPDRNGEDGRVVIATRESLQDTVNQVGQELTKRNVNIQPTLTARPGLALRVIVNKDLVLRPYQPLFYSRTKP